MHQWGVRTRTQDEVLTRFQVPPKAPGSSWRGLQSPALFALSPGSLGPGPSSGALSAARRLTPLLVILCISPWAALHREPLQFALNDWIRGIFYPDEGGS